VISGSNRQFVSTADWERWRMAIVDRSPWAVAGEHVQIGYGSGTRVALDAPSIRLKRGTRTALIGPNGAGKSTLLKAIVGLQPLTSGSMTVLGYPVGTCQQRIAYVPQRRDVDWRFPITVNDVALMGRDVHRRWPRRPQRTDYAIVREALEMVGMNAWAHHPIAALSGGQQQRVFLARALAQHAELLLLDEPFVGVDTATEAIIHRVITRLISTGCTVVVATHDLASIQTHFDAAVLLQQRIIANGTPLDVLQPSLLAEAYGGPLALFVGKDSHGLAD